jgi:hypothetical protein
MHKRRGAAAPHNTGAGMVRSRPPLQRGAASGSDNYAKPRLKAAEEKVPGPDPGMREAARHGRPIGPAPNA